MYEAEKERVIEAIGNQEYALAFRIAEGPAAEGCAWAQGTLGSLYQCGLGAERIDALALQWLRASADGGDGLACHNLGSLYAGGGRDVEPDMVLARRYWRLARTHGFEMALDIPDDPEELP